MKIKVYSQTGKPTDVKQALQYEKDSKKLYDRLYEKYDWTGLGKDERDYKIKMFETELGEREKVLKSNYDMYITVDMPKSGKAWKDLIMSFGCPVTIAITEQDKKLALFLMDAQY